MKDKKLPTAEEFVLEHNSRGFDVEEWAKGESYGLAYESIYYDSLIKGFKKHEELTKDRLYTFEEMKYMYECGRNFQLSGETTVSEAFAHLNKTSWNITFENGKIELI